MGQPKESLLLEGKNMLQRQISLLRTVARRVFVIGAPLAYLDNFDVPVIPDEIPGRGPLGGIYTSLLKSRTKLNLVLGCDLPFVSPGLLSYLSVRAISFGSDVTVPCSRDGRYQPLCAVYHRRALYAVRTRLSLGENKISGFFRMVRRDAVPWQKLANAGFRPSVFDNINSPEDYEYARRRVESIKAMRA